MSFVTRSVILFAANSLARVCKFFIVKKLKLFVKNVPNVNKIKKCVNIVCFNDSAKMKTNGYYFKEYGYYFKEYGKICIFWVFSAYLKHLIYNYYLKFVFLIIDNQRFKHL